jgi:hypothetical protein
VEFDLALFEGDVDEFDGVGVYLFEDLVAVAFFWLLGLAEGAGFAGMC